MLDWSAIDLVLGETKQARHQAAALAKDEAAP